MTPCESSAKNHNNLSHWSSSSSFCHCALTFDLISRAFDLFCTFLARFAKHRRYGFADPGPFFDQQKARVHSLRYFTMARSKRMTPIKKPLCLRHVASKVAGFQTPSKPATNPLQRKSGADLCTPGKWRVAVAYFQISKGRERLPRGGMAELKKWFESYNLTPRLVQRLVENYCCQQEEQSQQSSTGRSCSMSVVHLMPSGRKCSGLHATLASPNLLKSCTTSTTVHLHILLG